MMQAYSIRSAPIGAGIALLLCALLASLVSPVWAESEPVLYLSDSASSYRLGPQLQVLEDPSCALGIEDVRAKPMADRFSPLGEEMLRAGMTDSAYWLRFTLKDLSDEGTRWVLDVGNPLLGDLRLYHPDKGGGMRLQREGRLLPFSARPIHSRDFVFPLPLVKGQEQEFHLRVTSKGPLLAPLSVWERQAFFEREHGDQLLAGCYLGMISVLSVYALFLFLALREDIYLYCGLHFLSYGLFEAVMTGVAFEYLWPNSPRVGDLALTGLMGCATFASLALCRSFLETKRLSPLLDKGLFVALLLQIGLVASAPFLPYSTSLRLHTHASMVAVSLILLATATSLWRGYKPARFFLAASVCLFLGLSADFLSRIYTVVNTHFFLAYGRQIGSAFEAVLLALALMDRLNFLRREKEKANQLIAELNRQFLDANLSLENMVQARTRELQCANERLLELDRLKSAFITNVSHELRTPLTSIIGFTRVAKQRFAKTLQPYLSKADEKTRKVAEQTGKTLDIVSDESDRLWRMIEDVLDLTQLETGRMHWSFAPLDIRAVVEKVAARVGPGYENKHLPLRLDLAEWLPEMVGDFEMLDKLFWNLLDNALKFTSQGEVVCRIWAQREAVRVEVSDTGCGVPDNATEAVFKKFGQLGDVLTDKPQGAGLGLPICRAIVEGHGGRIWLENNPGGGSLFSFWLPLQGPLAAPTPASEEAKAVEVCVDSSAKRPEND
jgi:signal transduction histidine kinase